MPDILPEPTDINEMATPAPRRRRFRLNATPRPRQTIAVLIGIVIIAALALIASYIYDNVNNSDQNNTRKQDINYIAAELKGYHSLFGRYPTLSYLNSSTFSAFSPTLNRDKFKDPTGSSKLLSATIGSGRYAYQASPLACNNSNINCTAYKLTAVLSDGSHYSVSGGSVNQPLGLLQIQNDASV